MNWNIAFVIPRYRAASAGGAEVLCQHLAERLAGAGCRVTVFATCVRDHHTWANHFPEGEETAGPVRLRRFRVAENRNPALHRELDSRIHGGGAPLTLAEQETWLREGAYSEGLVRAVEADRDSFDCMLFIPYLFGTTVLGSRAAGDKALLIPCLHDEAFARLPVVGSMFQKARGVLFNSEPEQDLARRLYGLPENRCAVVGMGIDEVPGRNAGRFRESRGIRDPFLLYAGRREGGKNIPLLVEYFKIFKRHNPGPLKLVLMGSGAVDAGGCPDVVDLGFVSEQEKLDAMAAALAFCQPSVNESFSIVIMEAWLAGTPALVHARCPVTRHHCVTSNGGLFFDGYGQFEECLRYLLDHPGARQGMAESGRAYILDRYRWPRILEIFDRALQQFGIRHAGA